MPVIPVLGKLRQEDNDLEANLGFVKSSRLAWDT
jgi:hypothetical protein